METRTRSQGEEERLRSNGETVRRLTVAVARTEFLHQVPGLIKRVLSAEMWRERIIAETHQYQRFERFEDFVVAAPTDGLGATVEMVRNLLRDDLEAIDLFDRAMQKPNGTNQHSFLGVDNIHARPDGTSREAGLRRLRKTSPKLHAQVIEGKLTVNEALVKAGLRTPRISALVRPRSIAAAILQCVDRGQLTRADVAELITMLKPKR